MPCRSSIVRSLPPNQQSMATSTPSGILEAVSKFELIKAGAGAASKPRPERADSERRASLYSAALAPSSWSVELATMAESIMRTGQEERG